MKKFINILAASTMVIAVILSGCATSQQVKDKSGAQLWGENCNRCHNSPSMDQYSKEHWEVIGNHMRVRANVTDAEVTKIVDFLQGNSQ